MNKFVSSFHHPVSPLFFLGVVGVSVDLRGISVGSPWDLRGSVGRFLAQRYWWNERRDGRWLDVTPRPSPSSAQLLLVEPMEPAPTKTLQALSPKQAQLAARPKWGNGVKWP
jgi:hypothetical protein